MTVATSSNSTIFKLKSQNHDDLFGRFQTIVTGDDPAVHRGKPHPDIFQVCAERFGATVPQQVMIVIRFFLEGSDPAVGTGL